MTYVSELLDFDTALRFILTLCRSCRMSRLCASIQMINMSVRIPPESRSNWLDDCTMSVMYVHSAEVH
jgi:hypothetical protein